MDNLRAEIEERIEELKVEMKEERTDGGTVNNHILNIMSGELEALKWVIDRINDATKVVTVSKTNY